MSESESIQGEGANHIEEELSVGAVKCCFNCIHLGVKPISSKHWCVNDKSYLSGWITQPHISKCELHMLEK
jgi:hypothetical protein